MKNYEKYTLEEFSGFLLKKIKIVFKDTLTDNTEKTMVGEILECHTGKKTLSLERTVNESRFPFLCIFLNKSDNKEYSIVVKSIKEISFLNEK